MLVIDAMNTKWNALGFNPGLAVAHDEFKKKSLSDWDKHFKDMPNDEKVIIDIKSILDKEEVLAKRFRYWRL